MMNIFFVPILFFQLHSLPEFSAVQGKDEDYWGSIDEDPKITLFPGCSWYCGGHVDRFTASSELVPVGEIDYSAKNAHDFNPNTAWIEGKPDFGIQEYIEYTIDMTNTKSHNLGITKIIMANGYRKSKKTWNDNSRVKKLKMFIDEKPYAILNVLDIYEIQTINIGKIMLPQTGITRIKFQILEVYQGTKYKDTAITEMVFDGVGVH